MKNFLISLAVFLSMCGAAYAQTPVISKSGPYQPLGYCQITSLGSAVFLVSASCSTGSVPNGAVIAEICVSTQAIRYLDSPPGSSPSAPTTTIGMPVAPVSSTIPACFAYAITPLTQMQLIAQTAGAVVDVLFYR